MYSYWSLTDEIPVGNLSLHLTPSVYSCNSMKSVLPLRSKDRDFIPDKDRGFEIDVEKISGRDKRRD